ncbi:MAG: glycerol-3-phosphate 1-O-acyltransferase PlsY [Firmicutes bacterium]|nr:glycerol-3-phosphate 1-O-acyltransferase PlsY [Bacillota bacterium]
MEYLTAFFIVDNQNLNFSFLWIVALLIAYFLGNISPAILLGKAVGVDIKHEGSGNAGTTNVLRVLGKKSAAITLVIDILKGVLAVKLGFWLCGYVVGSLCAVAVFCGHIWPCFYHFKGGKGVATAFGTLLAIDLWLALAVLAVVAVFLFLSKRMSVGSLAGAVSFPVLSWFLAPGFFPAGCVMALIVIIKHRANIVRLLHGEEPKMSFKK